MNIWIVTKIYGSVQGGAGVAARTYSMLRTILQRAVTDGAIEKNPATSEEGYRENKDGRVPDLSGSAKWYTRVGQTAYMSDALMAGVKRELGEAGKERLARWVRERLGLHPPPPEQQVRDRGRCDQQARDAGAGQRPGQREAAPQRQGALLR